eukprot:TRINITY_DN15095_c0_g1_i1.p2 TRINITY_DN15095_c0_g1~~TRINITY_DN15095_c0_g1_i1.p2  ORF type:complete len:69 (+),score=3.74 TRINITY_DN15095_c0_g1_i1:135-341(+)
MHGFGSRRKFLPMFGATCNEDSKTGDPQNHGSLVAAIIVGKLLVSLRRHPSMIFVCLVHLGLEQLNQL